MTIPPGRHHLGPANGRITLRTSRDGLVAQAGHDLTIELTGWSGNLMVGADLAPAGLDVTVDLGTLVVRDGTGGIKPLSERDKREIAVTARKVLGVDRHPDATFTATGFETRPDASGGIITGTLTLAGQTRPQRLDVTTSASSRYRAATAVRQTDFGIKPYSAFLGSLKVSDVVQVEVDLDLSDAVDQEPAS